MPIILDTPLQIPQTHGEPAETYSEVEIVDFHVDIKRRQLRIITEYGNTVNGVWLPATKAAAKPVIVENRDAHVGPGGVEMPANPAFDILVGTTYPTSLSLTLFDNTAIALYTYLIASGYYVGTIQ